MFPLAKSPRASRRCGIGSCGGTTSPCRTHGERKRSGRLRIEDRKGAVEKEEEKENERAKKRKYSTYKPPVVEEDADGTYTGGYVHEVLLDDQRIRVRYNLWAALLAFREMAPFKDGMWLWNAALCINQQHETGRKERARQLPLMSLIYRQAGNIIFHASSGYFRDENTPWIFDYPQGIGANYRTEYEAPDHAEPTIAHSHRCQAKRELEKSAREWVEEAQTDMRSSVRQDDTDYAMISLYDFFDRPY